MAAEPVRVQVTSWTALASRASSHSRSNSTAEGTHTRCFSQVVQVVVVVMVMVVVCDCSFKGGMLKLFTGVCSSIGSSGGGGKLVLPFDSNLF